METENSQNDNNGRLQSISMIEKPVIDDIRSIGIDIEHVQDLYLKVMDYQAAIPILIKWLPLIENHDIKEQIVRALSVKWALGTKAIDVLINEYRNSKNDTNLCWAIGSAIEILASKANQDDLIELVNDKEYGSARQMLVLALSKMERSKVEPVLIQLLDDENLLGQSIYSLGKLKSINSMPYLEKYINHKNPWIRKTAKKALNKIRKVETKL